MPRQVDTAIGSEATATPPRLEGRGEQVALAAALVFYVVVSATRLDSTGLWADEAWSLAAVNHLDMNLKETHGTMGAYYVVLWAWAKVSTSTPWLRALSTVFGFATIVMTQVIARRIGGRRLAIWAPLFLVTSPMFLWTSTEARGYALETLVTAVCWYALIRLAGSGRRDDPQTLRWAAVFLAGVILGPLTHGLFVLQLVALGFWVLANRNRRRLITLTAPAFLGGLLVTLWLWSSGLKRAGTITLGTPIAILRELWKWFVSDVSWVAALVVVVMIGAAVTRRFGQAPKKRRHLDLGSVRSIPAIWALLPTLTLLAIRSYRDTWAAYYQSPVTPGVALLLGVGAVAVHDAVRSLRGTGRRIAGLVPACLVILLAIAVLASPRYKDEGWRQAAEAVAAGVEPGDVIVFTGGSIDSPMQSRAPFEAAWRETAHDIEPRSLAPERPLGSVRRIDDYPTPDQINREALHHDRVWFVDYKGVLSFEHIVDDPEFLGRFHRVSSQSFAGPITVALYEADG